MTLKRVSELSGLSLSHLSELERDTGKRASHDAIQQISQALNLNDRERHELLEAFGLGTSRPRAMLFIDGRWLETWGVRLLTEILKDPHRTAFEFDFDALAKTVGIRLGGNVEFTRKFFVSSLPVNVPPEDEALAAGKVFRNELLFARLRDRHRYEVIVAPADYRKKLRVRKEDRLRQKQHLPTPNPVPMVLSAEMMFYAALPNALDVAVLVAGDEVYRPAVMALRRLGKRVALATIRTACDEHLWGGNETLWDWSPIHLDDEAVINEIELKRERRKIECKAAFHIGESLVWAFEPPGIDEREYVCFECREKHQSTFKDRAEPDWPPKLSRSTDAGDRLVGIVTKIHNKGYGFITVEDKQDFFFHATALPANIEMYTLRLGDFVEFEPGFRPGEDPTRRSGTAKKVVPIARKGMASLKTPERLETKNASMIADAAFEYE